MLCLPKKTNMSLTILDMCMFLYANTIDRTKNVSNRIDSFVNKRSIEAITIMVNSIIFVDLLCGGGICAATIAIYHSHIKCSHI